MADYAFADLTRKTRFKALIRRQWNNFRRPFLPSRITPSRPGPANLVLIGIDTLRNDHLGFGGYFAPTSTCLDKLAASGTVFLDVTAPAPWTLPSFCSALTGLMPGIHGGYLASDPRNMDTQPPSLLNPNVTTLAGHLKKQGYKTAAFYSNQFFAFGLAESFDHHSYHNLPAEDLSQLAQEWIRRNADGPFFCFLLFNDPHEPTTPLPEDLQPFLPAVKEQGADTSNETLCSYARWGAEPALFLGKANHPANKTTLKSLAIKLCLYDATIHYVDRTIGRLHDQLKNWELAQNTLFSVFSDHGEEFLDHADFSQRWNHDPRQIHGIGHGHTHFQELLHVPWLAWGAGVPQGVRRREPVSLCDLSPTLLTWLGVQPMDLHEYRAKYTDLANHLADSLIGISVADPAALTPTEGTSTETPLTKDRLLLSEAIAYGPDLVALRQGRWKLIAHRDGRVLALFDLLSSPRENRDVSPANPEIVASLQEKLRLWCKSGAGAYVDTKAGSSGQSGGQNWDDIDDTVRQRLRDLGYSD